MLVSYNWLQEYFDDALPKPDELAGILNTRAFEIEGVEKVGDDYTIDVDVLPNRAHDCFSHYGIAKEISALTKIPIKEIEFIKHEADFYSKINSSILTKKCLRSVACEVQGAIIKESPAELKKKLEVIGQRSINTIVDITNVVMFEIGQAPHAFDRDKIEDDTFVVREATQGEKLTILGEKDVVLDKGMMVIADSKAALDIAGIKGGAKAELDESTKNVLLSAANFDSTSIRVTSRKVGVKTDASKRFEHGISPELAMRGMLRVIELVKKYASDENTKFSEIIDVYPRPPKHPYYVGTSIADLNKRLGLNLKDSEVEDIFDRLKFEYKKVSPKDSFLEILGSLVDAPYKYGASVVFDAPESFDCSSMVAYACACVGINIPRMAIDQYVWSDEISKNDLVAGDLVFANTHLDNSKNKDQFKDSEEILKKIKTEHDTTQEFLPGTKIEKPLDHVGVYLGDGKIIHCSSSLGKVTVEDLETSESFKDVIGYRRIFSNNNERYVISVPDERIDIRITEDLSEEVGRVYGYEHLPEPAITSIDRKPEINKGVAYNGIIRNALVDIGFSEIMTSSFSTKGKIKVVKSFADDRQYLRANLKDGMETALAMNVYNADLLGENQIKTFEIGTKFGDFGQVMTLCLGVENNKIKKPKPSEVLRDAISTISDVLNIKSKISIKDEDSVLEINLDELYENLPTPEKYADIYDIGDVKYAVPSQYPFVLRDISVWIPGSRGQEDLVNEIIKSEAGDLLANDTLVDVYEKTDEGKTSYSFRLVFQSFDKTLTDIEVNQIMDSVTTKMNSKEGWEVR